MGRGGLNGYASVSVKVTGISFIIRGVACHLMPVSVKVMGISFIFRGVACRPMTVGRAETGHDRDSLHFLVVRSMVGANSVSQVPGSTGPIFL